MGLTESNQSKSGFWGATKSKSTSHFLEGRSSYEGKPRQASTLPARTVSHERSSPILLTSSKKDENLSSVIRGRSPNRGANHRNCSLQREPTSWKEARNVRTSGISQSVDPKTHRQSNHFLDLSASPINVPPISYSPIEIKCVSRSTPFSSNPNAASLQPQLRSTAISASDAKECLNRQVRSSFRSSRRNDDCNRKGPKDDESPASCQKQTQTPSPFSLSMTTSADQIINAGIGTKNSASSESSKSSELLQNIDSTEVLDRVYHSKGLDNTIHIQKLDRVKKENSEGYCEIRRKKTIKASEKKFGIVPTTSSVVESDPYLCLFYNTSTNCQSVQENHLFDDEVETSRSSVYSKPYRSVPNKTVFSPDKVIHSPVNQHSQILIKVDNSEMSELDHSEPKKAIELFSNVCFESKIRTNEGDSLEDSNLTRCLVQETNSVRSKGDSDPLNSIALADSNITNNESHNSIRGTELHFRSPSFNSSSLNNKDKLDSHKKIPKHETVLSNEANNMFLSDNGNAIVTVNNNEDNTNVEKCDFLSNYNVPGTKPMDGPITFLSSMSRRHLVPELWPTDCNDESEQEILHEDKSIPIPPFLNFSQSFVSNYSTCPNYGDTEKTVPFETDKSQTIEKTVNSTEKNNSVHSSVSLFTRVPSSQNNIAKTATLPSPSGCPLSSYEFDLTGDQRQYTKFRRNTIHGLDGGVYPVLRLPKSESQPRLVDVLKKKEVRDQNCDAHRDSYSLLHDPLLTETKIGTGLKYSPLDENILYIAEGEFDKPVHPPSVKNDEDSQISFSYLNDIYSSTVIGNFAVDTIEENLAGIGSSVLVNSQASVVAIDHQEMDNNEKIIPDNSYSLPSSCLSLKPKNKNDIGVGLDNALRSQTFPSVSNSEKSHHLGKIFPSRLKTTSNFKKTYDCSLTCHEQCQNVVSLDCKIASSDEESLLENDFTLDRPSEESGTFAHDQQPLRDDLAEEEAEESLEKEENRGSETEKMELEANETEKEIDEEEEVVGGKEETHEEDKQVIEEHEYSTLKKSEEASTLRRTVYRIQSQAVDSAKIEEWVRKCPLTNVGLQIAKELDGGYRGCLRIHLNLCRPINIVAGTRPPSIYDILQEDRTMEKTLTSFYMPRDAVKAIHITSKTTTREVIVALLRKFKVVDNPHKFALYERTYDAGQSMRAKLRRLSDSECPLVLAIAWNAQGITNKRLVLQENDTADIQWEAFSLPELANFLRILDREEGEYKNQIKDKYALLRQRIHSQLARIAPVNT